MREQRIGYCAVSVWEIAWKHRLGKLPLPVPLADFDTALRHSGLIAHPADHELWWRMATMDWAHRDTADRMIVALAESLGRPLVTNDGVLARRYPDCVW